MKLKRKYEKILDDLYDRQESGARIYLHEIRDLRCDVAEDYGEGSDELASLELNLEDLLEGLLEEFLDN